MKTITEKILDGIKQTLETGEKVTIDLREAASLGGSGDGQGGRTFFDNAFAALRFGNPIREGARVLPISGSSMQFVAKTGNAANQTNPWGYSFTPNTGTPGTNTTIWQIPTRVITAQLPIRSAAMSDINYLNETLVEDLALEFATIEGSSMIKNDDQAGSLTTTTGGVDGLRGLNSYVSATTSAYGSSGTDGSRTIHRCAVDSTGLRIRGSPRQCLGGGARWSSGVLDRDRVRAARLCRGTTPDALRHSAVRRYSRDAILHRRDAGDVARAREPRGRTIQRQPSGAARGGTDRTAGSADAGDRGCPAPAAARPGDAGQCAVPTDVAGLRHTGGAFRSRSGRARTDRRHRPAGRGAGLRHG